MVFCMSGVAQDHAGGARVFDCNLAELRNGVAGPGIRTPNLCGARLSAGLTLAWIVAGGMIVHGRHGMAGS